MGATVTTGKLATAFKSLSGQTFFVLFEQTYEKNCHPHSPEWSCACFGTLEHVVRWVFLAGSNCEGGMLQNRSGHITPEGYIAGWFKELGAPVRLLDQDFDLQAGESFYSTVPTSRIEDVRQLCVNIGRDQVAELIAGGGTYTASLYKEAELLAGIYKGGSLAPWRLFRRSSAPVHGCRDASLGYCPEPLKAPPMQVPAFMKVDRYNRLIQRHNGTWYCGGWEYSIVGHFVANLWVAELETPGSFRKRIKAYRDAILSAADIPDGMKLVVDLSVPVEDKYRFEQISKLPQLVPVIYRENGFEVAVTRDEDLLDKLVRLPADSVSWITPAPALQTLGQLSLLSA